MISSVSDYKFVIGADIDSDHPHGDMDRIIIDGDIMPLREGTVSPTTGVDRSLILRGEDVAFPAEHALRMLNHDGVSLMSPALIGGNFAFTTVQLENMRSSFEFSRKISASQMTSLCEIYEDCITEIITPTYTLTTGTSCLVRILPFNEIPTQDLESDDDTAWNAWDQFYISSNDRSSDKNDFDSSESLEKSSVEKIFDDYSLVKAVVYRTDNHGSDFSSLSDSDVFFLAPSDMIKSASLWACFRFYTRWFDSAGHYTNTHWLVIRKKIADGDVIDSDGDGVDDTIRILFPKTSLNAYMESKAREYPPSSSAYNIPGYFLNDQMYCVVAELQTMQ